MRKIGFLLVLGMAMILPFLSASCDSAPTGSANLPTATPTPCAGTFGQPVTAGGSGYANFGTGYTWYSAYNLTQAGAITAIAANVPSTSTQLAVGVYTNNAAMPQSLIANSATVTTGVSGWVTVGFGPVNLSAGTYWLALALPSTSPAGNIGINTSAANFYGSASIFPTVFTNDNSQSYEMSVVAFYQHTCP